MRLVLIIFIIWSGSAVAQKITGLSLEAPPKPFVKEDLNPVLNINAKWVGIIPFGFLEKDGTKIHYDLEDQWWGEKTEGVIRSIQLSKETGLKVMLKPQLWISDQFVGHIDFSETPEKWEDLEKNYSQFILNFAKIADSLNIDLFSIGCEFKTWVVKRPRYWNNLIDRIKKIYNGKITYSANWDNFLNVPFWAKLDYIGVDSYFPMSDSETPSVKELSEKWDGLKNLFHKTHKKYGLPILFTEYGFRSVDRNVKETWDADRPGAVNEDAQRNAYKAFFNSIYNQPWFAGGFLWKWEVAHSKAGGPNNNRFTPQNKKAEKLIGNEFKRINSTKLATQ